MVVQDSQTPEDQEIVYLRKRTGFIEFAIKNGMDIVPIYGFGENQVTNKQTTNNKLTNEQ